MGESDNAIEYEVRRRRDECELLEHKVSRALRLLREAGEVVDRCDWLPDAAGSAVRVAIGAAVAADAVVHETWVDDGGTAFLHEDAPAESAADDAKK